MANRSNYSLSDHGRGRAKTDEVDSTTQKCPEAPHVTRPVRLGFHGNPNRPIARVAPMIMAPPQNISTTPGRPRVPGPRQPQLSTFHSELVEADFLCTEKCNPQMVILARMDVNDIMWNTPGPRVQYHFATQRGCERHCFTDMARELGHIVWRVSVHLICLNITYNVFYMYLIVNISHYIFKILTIHV